VWLSYDNYKFVSLRDTPHKKYKKSLEFEKTRSLRIFNYSENQILNNFIIGDEKNMISESLCIKYTM